VMADAGTTASRSEARRLIRGGGVYLNGARVAEIGAMVRAEDAIEGRFVIVRVGRKRHLVVEVVG
ncbi:MAG: tyrosine--tRNA ligase, partial [Gemmatimonadetes bacterium]|nr:tyrosine--tRNA ligase [Gemmatimonadota bacterium]